MSYSVVAVTSGQNFSNRVRAIFEETQELELVEIVERAGDALDIVSRRDCQAVLVDAGLSPTSPYDVMRDMQSRMPHIAVLLVAENTSSEALQAAVDVGARGVVQLSNFDDVRDRTLQAAQWSMKVRGRRMEDGAIHSGASTIITLVGAKGGVGTTSVAVHLARSLLSSSKRVCLVDLDLAGGDVTSLLNIASRRDVTDLVAVGDALSVQSLQDVLFGNREGLRVLCAPDHPELAERMTGEFMRTILVTLRQMFEYIVIDGGATATDSLGAAVEVSDSVVVVANPELTAIRGANRFVDMCQRLNLAAPEDLRVLLNRSSSKVYLQPSVVSRMLSAPLLEHSVRDSGKALEQAANNRDVSAVRDKEFLRSVARLAAEVTTSPAQPAAMGAPAPRSGRLSRRRSSEAGAVSVEFMVLVPFLLVILLACLQAVVYGAARVQAGNAAAAAAHACARGDDPAVAAADELRDRFRDRLSVSSCGDQGDRIHATVSVRVPALVPRWLMGGGSISVTSAAVDEE